MLTSWMTHEPNYADASGNTIHDYADVIGGAPKDGTPLFSSYLVSNLQLDFHATNSFR